MDKDDNVRVFDAWVKAHRAHDIDQMLSLVTENVVLDSAGFPGARGKQEATAHWQGIFRTFPDMKIEPATVTADADRVVTEVDFGGTMLGRLRDKEPTGKTFRIRGVFALDFEEGMIREIRSYYDSRVMMTQLGLIPG